MKNFKLGSKAIQTIQKVQADLSRFSRKERTSILRYLLEATSTAAVVGGIVRTRGTKLTAAVKSSRARKLSKVAKNRVRDASGHFVQATAKHRVVRRARTARSARAAA